eukprot:3510911-Rhodomonas_salina.1
MYRQGVIRVLARDHGARKCNDGPGTAEYANSVPRIRTSTARQCPVPHISTTHPYQSRTSVTIAAVRTGPRRPRSYSPARDRRL